VELIEFLGGVVTAGGKVKEDVSLIVPIALLEGKRIKEEGIADNIVPWCFSTFDLDRYDERVDPAGWVLEHYERNPVIQWAHRWDIPAIGRASDLVTDEGGLRGNIVFNAKDYDPFGWGIGERVKAGVLRAGSVGFRPLEVEIPEQGKKKDDTALIFRKQELLEFSICNVPANPFALRTIENQRAVKAIQKDCGGWGWIMK
jgi:HK97 family phage prohead protease